jgi:hypothetical protein
LSQSAAKRSHSSLSRELTAFSAAMDGHTKASFEAKDSALEAARELKARFPHLQVKVFDAETKRSEAVAGA